MIPVDYWDVELTATWDSKLHSRLTGLSAHGPWAYLHLWTLTTREPPSVRVVETDKPGYKSANAMQACNASGKQLKAYCANRMLKHCLSLCSTRQVAQSAETCVLAIQCRCPCCGLCRMLQSSLICAITAPQITSCLVQSLRANGQYAWL